MSLETDYIQRHAFMTPLMRSETNGADPVACSNNFDCCERSYRSDTRRHETSTPNDRFLLCLFQCPWLRACGPVHDGGLESHQPVWRMDSWARSRPEGVEGGARQLLERRVRYYRRSVCPVRDFRCSDCDRDQPNEHIPFTRWSRAREREAYQDVRCRPTGRSMAHHAGSEHRHT